MSTAERPTRSGLLWNYRTRAGSHADRNPFALSIRPGNYTRIGQATGPRELADSVITVGQVRGPDGDLITGARYPPPSIIARSSEIAATTPV